MYRHEVLDQEQNVPGEFVWAGTWNGVIEDPYVFNGTVG